MSELVPMSVPPGRRLEGQVDPLAQRIAAPSGLSALASASRPFPREIRDLPGLRGFLSWYRTEVLVPVELPAIRRAWDHAGRYEVRELMAFDRSLRGEARWKAFAGASRAVGRVQLWRLLPLRDQRIVRRYWHATECGEADAWHVLVYGLVLELYSLPLRQGLLHYSRRTLSGFLESDGPALRLSPEARREFLEQETVLLHPAVDRAVGPGRVPLMICR